MIAKPSLVKTYETISVLAFFSIIAGLWFQQPVFYYLAFSLLFLVIFVKKAASWVARGWLLFAHFVGTVNTKIILTLIFFLILTPIAFCYRLLHGDFLKIKQRSSTTYWVSRDHIYEKTDLEKVW